MRRTFTLVVCAVLVTSSILFGGCENKDKVSLNNNEKLKNLSLPKGKDSNIDLDIYLDASKDDKTPVIAKEERLVNKEELIGQLIMQELINGPSINSNLKPILPKESRLLSFSIKDGIAYVNLSKDARVFMTPTKEEACLESISASLSQLSSVNKVKILIENRDTNTLGGNFDISTPFGKDDIDGRRKKE